ncbi:MAG: hypothetical protein EOP88_09460 [Verrucomicrobiaceae bacterium]|nr:MAG: hypothetical protein EOP88_09460 [Verrucomicrobiaceae bacterium]
MKASLVLTAIILSAAGLLGWHGHTHMESARETREKLRQQAAGEAVSPTAPASRDDGRPAVDGGALAAGMISAEDRTAEMEKHGGGLALLDDKGMQAFVAGIMKSPALDEKTRGEMVLDLLRNVLTDRPRASLSLFEQFRSAGGTLDMHLAPALVHHSLEQLATEDTSAALDWLRAKGGKHPEFVNDTARAKVLTAVAAGDPQRAFREMGQVGIGEPQDAIGAIMRAGQTPAQRLAVIAALRGHLASMPDQRLRKERSDAAITQLAASALNGGDASARQWVAAARFTPTEMEAFAKEISSRGMDPREIGGWVECLASAGAEIFPGQPVHQMVTYWTRHDYRAAGEWLLTTRGGPAKHASVRAYAETVAKYEPEVAEQWAMTLPAGKDRDETLAKIRGK